MTLLSLEQVITQRIASEGRITFADFMELALYWPNGGYYTSPRPTEPAPDYFTAPQAHPSFGALLALQLEEMWQLLGRPNPFDVVEQGAGSRQLARDIQGYAQHLHASFSQALRYVTVDRSAGDTSGEASGPSNIVSTGGLPFRRVTGCVLSNELLDALPVHRVVVRGGRLKEIYVTMKDDQLQEVEDEPSTDSMQARLEQEQVRLQEGHRTEVCLELDSWMGEVAATLERGFVLTIDYGHAAHELYSPARSQGTLRCYYLHTLTANPYVRIGQQDVTAHVDFTAVASLGARNGLAGLPLITQGMFLNNLGLQMFLRRLSPAELDQTARDANRMGMLELARAGGMGEFKVLVQSKGLNRPEVTGTHGATEEWKERLGSLPLPLLDADHLSLMLAKYPHGTPSWENLWPSE